MVAALSPARVWSREGMTERLMPKEEVKRVWEVTEAFMRRAAQVRAMALMEVEWVVLPSGSRDTAYEKGFAGPVRVLRISARSRQWEVEWDTIVLVRL